jgi:hypothetical protein
LEEANPHKESAEDYNADDAYQQILDHSLGSGGFFVQVVFDLVGKAVEHRSPFVTKCRLYRRRRKKADIKVTDHRQGPFRSLP